MAQMLRDIDVRISAAEAEDSCGGQTPRPRSFQEKPVRGATRFWSRCCLIRSNFSCAFYKSIDRSRARSRLPEAADGWVEMTRGCYNRTRIYTLCMRRIPRPFSGFSFWHLFGCRNPPRNTQDDIE